MNGLPWNWRRKLRQCNMFLARRKMAEFFRFMNRSAEAQGQRVAYRTEFLAGWREFDANPCYETAVVFLKKAGEAAPTIFANQFIGESPGGHLYNPGIKTARSFVLGEYSLDMPLSSWDGLTELTDAEYRHIPRTFEGEIICHAPPAEFVARRWPIRVRIAGDAPWQFDAVLEFHELGEGRQAAESALAFCEGQLGTPTCEEYGLFCWLEGDGSVSLAAQRCRDGIVVRIFVASGDTLPRPITFETSVDAGYVTRSPTS